MFFSWVYTSKAGNHTFQLSVIKSRQFFFTQFSPCHVVLGWVVGWKILLTCSEAVRLLHTCLNPQQPVSHELWLKVPLYMQPIQDTPTTGFFNTFPVSKRLCPNLEDLQCHMWGSTSVHSICHSICQIVSSILIYHILSARLTVKWSL